MSTTTTPCPCGGTFTVVADDRGGRGSCDSCAREHVWINRGQLDIGIVSSVEHQPRNDVAVFHEEWTGFQVLRDLPTGDGRQP